jgi:hypothetical protein
MPCRKIANWTMIRNMCHRRFVAQTAEELEMQAMELARKHAKDEVVAFEREGEVAQVAMVRVLEDTAAARKRSRQWRWKLTWRPCARCAMTRPWSR